MLIISLLRTIVPGLQKLWSKRRWILCKCLALLYASIRPSILYLGSWEKDRSNKFAIFLLHSPLFSEESEASLILHVLLDCTVCTEAEMTILMWQNSLKEVLFNVSCQLNFKSK